MRMPARYECMRFLLRRFGLYRAVHACPCDAFTACGMCPAGLRMTSHTIAAALGCTCGQEQGAARRQVHVGDIGGDPAYSGVRCAGARVPARGLLPYRGRHARRAFCAWHNDADVLSLFYSDS